jgi:hypothetical protein
MDLARKLSELRNSGLRKKDCPAFRAQRAVTEYPQSGTSAEGNIRLRT